MPQVPNYDNFQATQAPLPDVRAADVQPGNSALQLGQTLNRVGAETTDAAIRLQERANADAVFKAEADLKDQYLQFEQGVRQRRGTQAWGVTNDASQWWEKNTKAITDNLQNDRQRQIFAHSATALRQSSLTSISSYENEQQHASVEDSAKASITGSINIAAANPTDPNILAQSKSDILKRVQVIAQVNGWSPERYTVEQGNAVTDLHKQVIQSQIDTRPDLARAYFDQNKDQINGADRDTIDKQIRVGTIRQIGQQASDTIIGQGLSESDSLAKARAKYTGEQQDEVVRRLKERFADIDMERERGQAQAADKAWQIWSQNRSISDVPTSVLNSMDGKMRVALEQEDAAHASGADIKTDWSTFYDLRQSASLTPQQFAKTDIRQFFPKLNPAQREQLIDAQNQIKSNTANDVQTLDGQLGRAHELLGWSASDAQKKGQFDSAALTAIDAAQKANGGKKLTFDERQKVVDRMMVTGSYPGGNWFSKDSFYQVAGTEKAAQFAPKVPDDERAKIEAALTRAKKPITDDAVLQLYKLKNGLP
jgi:hypothetical protein